MQENAPQGGIGRRRAPCSKTGDDPCQHVSRPGCREPYGATFVVPGVHGRDNEAAAALHHHDDAELFGRPLRCLLVAPTRFLPGLLPISCHLPGMWCDNDVALASILRRSACSTILGTHRRRRRRPHPFHGQMDCLRRIVTVRFFDHSRTDQDGVRIAERSSTGLIPAQTEPACYRLLQGRRPELLGSPPERRCAACGSRDLSFPAPARMPPLQPRELPRRLRGSHQ